MITTPKALEKLCRTVTNSTPHVAQNVSISHRIYRLFTKWQFKDKYPELMGWRSHGAYYMARVR